MLPFVLILCAVIYCVCYWIWSVAQSQPQNVADVINIITAMLFLPGTTIFFLLRGLLLLTACYVLADFLFSLLRRKRRVEEEENASTLQLKFITPRK